MEAYGWQLATLQYEVSRSEIFPAAIRTEYDEYMAQLVPKGDISQRSFTKGGRSLVMSRANGAPSDWMTGS